jgi:cation transport ATPase
LSQRKRKPGRGPAAVIPPSSTYVRAPTAPTSSDRAPASATTPTPAVPQLTRRQTAQFRAAQRRHAAQIRAAQNAAHEQHWIERYSERAEIRNAEAREKLVPLPRNEQPWALRISVALAMIFSLGTLALWVGGVKIDNHPPATSWFLYVVVMFTCGVGMWRHWYQAVLAFMCLLGIALIILCALVVRFSNLLGLLVPLVLIVSGGALFWKLVRVLARLQMPERRTRSV